MASHVQKIALAFAAALALGTGAAVAEASKADTKADAKADVKADADTMGDSKAERDRGVPGVDVDVDIRARMGKLDTNKDNKISKTEAKVDKSLAKEFSKLDKDNNSLLDRGEFSKFEFDVDIGEPGDQKNIKDDPAVDELGPGR